MKDFDPDVLDIVSSPFPKVRFKLFPSEPDQSINDQTVWSLNNQPTTVLTTDLIICQVKHLLVPTNDYENTHYIKTMINMLYF